MAAGVAVSALYHFDHRKACNHLLERETTASLWELSRAVDWATDFTTDDWTQLGRKCDERSTHEMMVIEHMSETAAGAVAICLPSACQHSALPDAITSLVQQHFSWLFPSPAPLSKQDVRRSLLAVPGIQWDHRCHASCPTCAETPGLESQSCARLLAEYRLRRGTRPWPKLGNEGDPRFRCGLLPRVIRRVPTMTGHSEACRSRRLARPPARARLALAPRWVSEVAKAADKPTLFVAVLCRPQDVVLRSSVRTGWASGGDSDRSPWRYGFVMGWSGLSGADQEHLVHEADSFGDIIAIDVVDAYTNLTLKVCHLLHLAVQIQSEYFLRLNGNERLQVGRLMELLRKDLQLEKLHPNGFVWGQRGCMLPHVFEELSCGTTSLKDWPLLVDGLLLPYPQASWLASRKAYENMAAVLQTLVGSRLLLHWVEDAFMGMLATAADVPILDIAIDGRFLFLGVNCSQGYVLLEAAFYDGKTDLKAFGVKSARKAKARAEPKEAPQPLEQVPGPSAGSQDLSEPATLPEEEEPEEAAESAQGEAEEVKGADNKIQEEGVY
ncbi:hypothetical protein AK812_SmicGene15962 [Symbiodinium microadriaticum]|uniref:Uncharacterized protein n=1 Tax=Symbiodinium microadriaticum TaxID=2951 RepID=A0A1Q9E1M6_SYMMI|nr:hypothetical protein AK812_SmicGene15962 [Symbiodinium microadriaticum]